MKTIKFIQNKAKILIKVIINTYKETPTEKEWKEWNNVSLWNIVFEKWLVLLEWLTILGVLEAIKLNTNIWQFNIILSLSWLIFYFYINNVVVIVTSKITIFNKKFLWISIVLSGIISLYLYSFVNDVVLIISKY